MFTADESNFASSRRSITGIVSIYYLVNGTTGEWPSLSVAERKIIAEEWIKYGAKKYG